MDCRTARKALSAMADGELAPGGIENLEVHLGACRDCARAARFLETVSDHFRSLPRPAAPRGIPEAVLARIRKGEGRILPLLPLVRGVAAAAAVLLVVTGAAIVFTKPRAAGPPTGLTADAAVEQIMDAIVLSTRPRLRAQEEDQ